MDGFAYKILTANEFESLAISILTAVMAAGMTVFFYRPTWTLPRPAYFLFLCLCVAASELSYLLQYLFADAIKYQKITHLAVLYIVTWMVIGAVSGVISAARSRDAFGSISWWPAVFVPFANLVLILYPSRDSRPKGTSQWLRNIALVVSGFVLVGATRAIPAPSEEYILSLSERAEADTDLGIMP